MRIGHCQIEVKLDFEANLAKVVTYLERAAKDRVEIVCFPECFLTGYPDTEELARKGAFTADSPQMMKVLDQTSSSMRRHRRLQRTARHGPLQHRRRRLQGAHPRHVQQVLGLHAVSQAGPRVPGLRAQGA